MKICILPGDGIGPEIMALFAAHFCEGLDIGDGFVLSALAGAAGLEAGAARAFLDSDEEMEPVQAENLRAHRRGITGVPCFVRGGRHAIGMKVFASGRLLVGDGAPSAEDCLRFAYGLDVSTTIVGCASVAEVELAARVATEA